MSYLSELSQSQEYLSFRSSIPLRKIVVDSDSSKGWKLYDSGPKSVKTPLVCLPPVSGTADVFFKQLLPLSAKGIRVIAAEHPVYWDVGEWCEGFKKLLDYLGLAKVHLFGASLGLVITLSGVQFLRACNVSIHAVNHIFKFDGSVGGFLAQKFAEYTAVCPRVASLILCNTFTDTAVFSYSESAVVFWMLPSLILKKMVMGNFNTGKVDTLIADSIDFMVERLESLSQQELASRLTMNCINCYVEPQKIITLPITILDVFDEYALSNTVREEMYKCYPTAKLAHLKSGGNFPYLSRSDEVNLHLQIHLRQFDETNLSAAEPGSCLDPIPVAR